MKRGPFYLFVTGGVVSSLGKGITTASIGLLLKRRGLKVAPLKFDPYLNVDAGTMNPYQHGEVYVTEDGAETDLDLGHYERFLDTHLSALSNVTSGQVYSAVIEKERRGDYLGQTVQVIPHLTAEIQRRIRLLEKEADVVLVEVGGTVGDIESLPFLEAIRQLSLEAPGRSFFLHVTLVPFVPSAGELKTKPTQHSVQKLREIGIQPHAVLCRTDRPLPPATRKKIALFSNLPIHAVFTAPDVDTIYEVPLLLHEEGLDRYLLEFWGIGAPEPDLSEWKTFVHQIKHPRTDLRVAVVGKYIHLRDAYKSIAEALTHAAAFHGVSLTLDWVDAEELQKVAPEERLKGVDGVLIPGGFGRRGIEGKIRAIRFAREEGIPFFGICLGMQLVVIEYARNVVGLEGAHSTEFDASTPHPVVDLLPEHAAQEKGFGGTLRLGASPVQIRPDTLAWELYGQEVVLERHRHRYELSPAYRETLENAGLVISGLEPVRNLAEIVELPRDRHPFFVATQFHPEFKSRPLRPHPVFRGFVGAMLKRRLAPATEGGAQESAAQEGTS